MNGLPFAIGAACAVPISLAALHRGALSRSGSAAAVAVGALTYGAGGWPMTVVVVAFFVSSVLLGRVGRARKKRLTTIGKGGARDAWQVLANGGVATLCGVFAYAAGPDAGRVVPWACAFAGAYAAATADTWGTEIGTLFKRLPRSIVTLRPVATGLSGGVTLPGTAAEIAGAAWIALVAALVFRGLPSASEPLGPRIAVAVIIAGVAGALIDSLLGATLQELRSCPACGSVCETNPHACGAATTLVRGLRGFSNDLVNAAATSSGALVALLLSPR